MPLRDVWQGTWSAWSNKSRGLWRECAYLRALWRHWFKFVAPLPRLGDLAAHEFSHQFDNVEAVQVGAPRHGVS